MRIRTTVAFALIVAWAGALSPALAGTPVDRCIRLVPEAQAFELAPKISPDCLQLKPDGQLAPAGAPGSCLASDPATKSLSIVDRPLASTNCVSLELTAELVKRIAVMKGPGGACFGADAQSGAINIAASGSPNCLSIVDDPKACPAATGPLYTIGGTPRPNCLVVDPGTRQLYFPGTGWRDRQAPVVRVGIDYAQYKTPKVNTGTLITNGPGSEVAAIIARQDAEGMQIDVSLLTRQFGEFGFEYFQGDATQTVTEPMGGAQIGGVFHAPSPSGSLGINFGRSGALFKLDTDHQFFFLGYKTPFTIHRYETEDCKYTLRPRALFGWSKTEFDSVMQSLAAPGIFSEARQEVEEWQLGVGLSNAYSHRLGYNIVGRFMLNLDILYRNADLKSVQRNVCSAPGCPPSATFDASVSDSDSGFTWQAGVTFGLDYSFNPNSRIGVEAGYRHIGETAQLKNPTLTVNFDQPPHLGDQSAGVFKIGVTYRYQF